MSHGNYHSISSILYDGRQSGVGETDGFLVASQLFVWLLWEAPLYYLRMLINCNLIEVKITGFIIFHRQYIIKRRKRLRHGTCGLSQLAIDCVSQWLASPSFPLFLPPLCVSCCCIRETTNASIEWRWLYRLVSNRSWFNWGWNPFPPRHLGPSDIISDHIVAWLWFLVIIRGDWEPFSIEILGRTLFNHKLN